jgi:hypothetical protein
VVVFKGTGTADPSASCGDTGDPFQLLDFYLETDTSEIYQCVAIDTWVLSSQLGDNKVIVGSGSSAPTVETLPDCDDTGGNHLNYNTTGTVGSRFSCGTSGGSSSDPVTALDLYDEFISGEAATGEVGNLGWSCQTIGGGGTYSLSEAGHADLDDNPGLLKLTASTDNQGILCYLGSALSTATRTVKTWSLDFVVVPGGNAAYGVTSSAMWLGLSAGLDPTTSSGGIWARRDTDRSDTTWVFAVCDSATTGCQSDGDDTNQDVAASTITPSNRVPTRVRIRHNPTGVGGNPTIYFRVNDETEVDFCSSGCAEDLGNLSTADLQIVMAFATRETAAHGMDVDMAHIQISPIARY